MRQSRFEKLEESINRFVENEDKTNCRIVGFIDDNVKPNLKIAYNRVQYRDLISVTFSKVCFFQTELEYYLQQQKIYWRNSSIFLFSDNTNPNSSSNLYNVNRGIICKVFEDLLKNFRDDIRMSYFFIHQENVYDLLSDRQPIRSNIKAKRRMEAKKYSGFLYDNNSRKSVGKSRFEDELRAEKEEGKRKKVKRKVEYERPSDNPAIPPLTLFSKLKKVKVGFHNFRRLIRNGQEKCKKQWKYGIKVLTFYFDDGKKKVNFIEFFDVTPLTDYYLNYSFDNSFNLINNVSNTSIIANNKRNNLNSKNSKILQVFLRIMKSLFKNKSKNIKSVPYRQTKLTYFLKESLRNCVFIVALNNKKEMLNMLKFSRNLTFVNQKLSLISKLKNTIMDLREANHDVEDENRKLRNEVKNCVGAMQKLNLALNEKEKQNENLKKEKNQYLLENLKLVKKVSELEELKSENSLKAVIKKLLENEEYLRIVRKDVKGTSHKLQNVVNSIQISRI